MVFNSRRHAVKVDVFLENKKIIDANLSMKAFFQSGGNPGSHFCKIDSIKNKFLKKGRTYCKNFHQSL